MRLELARRLFLHGDELLVLAHHEHGDGRAGNTVEAATKQAQMPNAPLKPRAVPDTAATSGTPMASQMGLPKNTMP